ncbi:hypothetical protein GQF61_14745 [Sphingobacterium sp. DK4209]|uniref:Integral membrane protein n=1 Tax=Sphingobacterium zhuxiongii TaxID=2662364 RepID=A0A5Q0Q8Y0_9SPHI|nr:MULTISPECIES: hypothetical protein [unclassified Sphingobacterium]MVZ67117.1 hypothetical protein [Sphingobacterium sp. DK4209]QGA25983.1 hypothetical protein GFH32_06485 [Sphingobacterium sp. dk4302]
MIRKLIYSVLVLVCLFNGIAVEAQDLKAARQTLGKASHPALSEISGIIASRQYPGKYWVHNDSGDSGRIFLIDSVANLQCEFYLEGVHAVDVEDIAWVNNAGRNYILLADIGDNQAKRSEIKLYYFEEPKLSHGKRLDSIPASQIQEFTLRFPDKSRDAEAIFVDPIDQRFYLISKRDFYSTLYTADIFQNKQGKYTLKKLLELPFTFITASDITSTGDALIMKNLTQIFFWERNPKESILSTLKKPYKRVAYQVEPQGEAIAFDLKPNNFVTISERPFGLDAYLYQYKITKP